MNTKFLGIIAAVAYFPSLTAFDSQVDVSQLTSEVQQAFKKSLQIAVQAKNLLREKAALQQQTYYKLRDKLLSDAKATRSKVVRLHNSLKQLQKRHKGVAAIGRLKKHNVKAYNMLKRVILELEGSVSPSQPVAEERDEAKNAEKLLRQVKNMKIEQTDQDKTNSEIFHPSNEEPRFFNNNQPGSLFRKKRISRRKKGSATENPLLAIKRMKQGSTTEQTELDLPPLNEPEFNEKENLEVLEEEKQTFTTNKKPGSLFRKKKSADKAKIVTDETPADLLAKLKMMKQGSSSPTESLSTSSEVESSDLSDMQSSSILGQDEAELNLGYEEERDESDSGSLEREIEDYVYIPDIETIPENDILSSHTFGTTSEIVETKDTYDEAKKLVSTVNFKKLDEFTDEELEKLFNKSTSLLSELNIKVYSGDTAEVRTKDFTETVGKLRYLFKELYRRVKERNLSPFMFDIGTQLMEELHSESSQTEKSKSWLTNITAVFLKTSDLAKHLFFWKKDNN